MSQDQMMSEKSFLMENAISSFMADAVIATKKVQTARKNMECRRKLEQRMEERKLRQEISEFEFQLTN